MKKAVLFLILTAIFLLVGKCSLSIYKGFKNIPEHATEAVLSKKYMKLIANIDEQIKNSKTALSMSANLEAIDYPKETLYVGIEKDSLEDDIVIFDKSNGDSRNFYISNGFGYGSLGSEETIIIIRPIDKYGLDAIEIFIKENNNQAK